MEKEKLLDAKIEQIRKKAREQEERERRLREEEEMILAELGYGPKKSSESKEVELDQSASGADDSQEVKPLTVRSAHMDDPEVLAAATKATTDGLKWRDERLQADRERESRAKRADGTFAREWDEGKDQVFIGHKDVEAITSGSRRNNYAGNGYNNRSGNNNRRSDPVESYSRRGRGGGGGGGQNANQRLQTAGSGGWSPTNQLHQSQSSDQGGTGRGDNYHSRGLRRSFGEDGPQVGAAENHHPRYQVDQQRERRTSAGEQKNNGHQPYENTRLRRGGAGRGLVSRGPQDRERIDQSKTEEKKPPTQTKENEDWCSDVSAPSSEQKQEVPPPPPSQPSQSETIETSPIEEIIKQSTEVYSCEPSSEQRGLKTQGSEEEQFEDVNEEMPSSKIEPDAPSSAFASMSASSVDLGQPEKPASNFNEETQPQQNEDVGEQLAADQVVSGAIDAALNVVENEPAPPEEKQEESHEAPVVVEEKEHQEGDENCAKKEEAVEESSEKIGQNNNENETENGAGPSAELFESAHSDQQ